jgi:hypothetical protein
MNEMITKYGKIQGIYLMDTHANGNLKDCVLNKPNIIKTKYGNLIPQYEDNDQRRKCTVSLSFYEDENLKSISLQEQIEIETPLGTLKAEYIILYKNGNIKRIFPLNGKLTGYWGEDDEYSLAEEFNFDFSFAKFKQRIIGANFFENKEPKSITLWPKDKVTIESPIGTVEVRIGFSLYADGKLESFEPYMPIKIETPIGKITAYDRHAIGIHADSNSIKFSQDGRLEALSTSSNEVEVTDKNGIKIVYKPQLQPSQIDETVIDIIPMKIEFLDNKVRFNNSEEEYSIAECEFLISIASLNIGNSCSSCSNCSSCSGCS